MYFRGRDTGTGLRSSCLGVDENRASRDPDHHAESEVGKGAWKEPGDRGEDTEIVVVFERVGTTLLRVELDADGVEGVGYSIPRDDFVDGGYRLHPQ